MLTHLDLFSGIGGFALAAEWAGFRTIGFVEIDKYCQEVLKRHWPNVPIVGDIRDVKAIREIVADTERQSEREPHDQGDSEPNCQQTRSLLGRRGTTARSGDGNCREPPVTLVTGGFPCQPFSVAGKRRGTADNRYLWNEMLAVIKAVKPAWVLGENVAGIAGMVEPDSFPDLESEAHEEGCTELSAVLARICSDLEGAGYEVQPLVIPACAVDAPHRRDRVWIVANSTDNGRPRPRLPVPGRRSKQENLDIGRKGKDLAVPKGRDSRQSAEPEGGGDSGGGGQKVPAAHPERAGLEGGDAKGNQHHEGQPLRLAADAKRDGVQGGQPVGHEASGRDWWATEPELGRVAHGVPHRVDRLRCLGNAIVPQVAYRILSAIAEIERGHC
jgi:DNA (cytosine-5)-methyltransferase 1